MPAGKFMGQSKTVWIVAGIAGLALAYFLLRRSGSTATGTSGSSTADLGQLPDTSSTAAPVLGGTPDGSSVGVGVSPDVLANVIGSQGNVISTLGLGALGLAATAEQQVGQMGVGTLSLAANAQDQVGSLVAASIERGGGFSSNGGGGGSAGQSGGSTPVYSPSPEFTIGGVGAYSSANVASGGFGGPLQGYVDLTGHAVSSKGTRVGGALAA